jgi:transcriptional regulator with XRE-family HTH domain
MREDAGYSRPKFARASGVGLTTIARMELQGHTPKVSVLRRMADALGVTVTDLLTDSEAVPAVAATPAPASHDGSAA